MHLFRGGKQEWTLSYEPVARENSTFNYSTLRKDIEERLVERARQTQLTQLGQVPQAQGKVSQTT